MWVSHAPFGAVSFGVVTSVFDDDILIPPGLFKIQDMPVLPYLEVIAI
jgi:hypothetical protein